MIAERNYFRARKGNIFPFVAHLLLPDAIHRSDCLAMFFYCSAMVIFPQKMCSPQSRHIATWNPPFKGGFHVAMKSS